MTKPTLVFVPGLWEGPTAFSKVLHILTSTHSYPVHTISLPSTGSYGPNAKLFLADVNAIRRAVEDLANQGKEIFLIMHSAGGYLGSQAIQDLGLVQRQRRWLAGGVKKLVYLAAALFPEGSKHPPQPLFQTTNDRMYCGDPVTCLFNDFPPSEAETLSKELSWQPETYVDSIYVNYGAWNDIPSVYLCCTRDQMIPLRFQKQIAAGAGAETEDCDAGHMVILSQPERVAEFVRKAAGET